MFTVYSRHTKYITGKSPSDRPTQQLHDLEVITLKGTAPETIPNPLSTEASQAYRQATSGIMSHQANTGKYERTNQLKATFSARRE